MTIDDVIEGYEIRENKYVLVENKGTFAERILCAVDTEIEALRMYRKLRTKLKVIVKANVRYAEIEGMKFLYDYKEIQ